jgi:hypothetical protein
MSFLIALLVLISMQAAPEPETKSQTALAFTIILGSQAIMVGNFFVWIGWVDWSYWAAIITLWIWFMVRLGLSKPGEQIIPPWPISNASKD